MTGRASEATEIAVFGGSLQRLSEEEKERHVVANAIMVRAHSYRDLAGRASGKKCVHLRKQAFRYRDCGMHYVYLSCSDCKQAYLGPFRCELRICSTCARKYANRIRQKQSALIKELTPRHGRRLMFLTATKKTKGSSIPTNAELKLAFKEFRKLVNKLYPGKSGCGAFASLEIGKGNNVHIHAIVYGYFVPQKKISELWLEITNDSQVVFITEVRSPIKCLNYLLKYISKPPEFDTPDEMAAYLDSIAGLRRIHTYGVFYNYPFGKKETFLCQLCGSRLEYKRITCELDPEFPANAIYFSKLKTKVWINMT